MRVRVRSWHGVASWLWVANDENCGICRMAFNGCCPDSGPAALPHVPPGVEVQGVTAGPRRYTPPGGEGGRGRFPLPAAGSPLPRAALCTALSAGPPPINVRPPLAPPVSRVLLRSGAGTGGRKAALPGAGASGPAPSLSLARPRQRPSATRARLRGHR
ncbi:anaphase-promoting complex subunit 11 isoform X1 [Balearica regulorum gibbericeps]|uniref:anaphase-promoting complex subunit 11 isoform X1 n=1 Tax=Balearica regulorum gibbericeps TaxID=100784 RepID=UPI003F62585E